MRMAGTRGETVANLCFHGIGTPRRELEPGEDRYWVRQGRFLTILDDLATWPVPVKISFDDGNRSDLDIALPALAERGLRADFFVLAGRLSAAGSLDTDGVRELHAHGMGVGTHGMVHHSWRRLDAPARNTELVRAREHLAGLIGAPVDTAACPLGRYDRRLLSELRRLGYRRVYTSDRRLARAAAWLQPRFSVRRWDSPGSLRVEVLRRRGTGRALLLDMAGLIKRLR
jgi:peptidoglycan/xylan/chitin deacetylase (PgdA/CDA1 family)